MSFMAVIIACHIASADMCMSISDQRGPYDTEEECKERIGEMAEDLINLWTYTRTPMVFKLVSCVHPDELIEKTQV